MFILIENANRLLFPWQILETGIARRNEQNSPNKQLRHYDGIKDYIACLTTTYRVSR